MGRIIGARRHSQRLKAMTSRSAQEEIGKKIYVGADMLRIEAQRLIVAGSVSGAGHVVSKPHEPPNEDTGVLRAGITNRRTGILSAETRSEAPYAAHLEWGTSKMIERPYMRPAAQNIRPKLALLVGSAINIVIRRG